MGDSILKTSWLFWWEGNDINGYNQIHECRGVYVYLCNSFALGGSTNEEQLLLYNLHCVKQKKLALQWKIMLLWLYYNITKRQVTHDEALRFKRSLSDMKQCQTHLNCICRCCREWRLLC